MSQNRLVHERLKRGPLTPLQAMQELGCIRLAARVHELRQAGVEVKDRWLEVPSRHGVVRVKQYRL